MENCIIATMHKIQTPPENPVRIIPSINGGWLSAEAHVTPRILDLHVQGENYCVGVMRADPAGYDFQVGPTETITFINETAQHQTGSGMLAPKGEPLHIDVDAPTAYICDFSDDGAPPSEENRATSGAMLEQLDESLNFKEIEGGNAIEFVDAEGRKNLLVVLRPGAACILPALAGTKRRFTFMAGNIRLTGDTVARTYLRFSDPKRPALHGFAELPAGEEGRLEARGETTAAFLCTEIDAPEVAAMQAETGARVRGV